VRIWKLELTAAWEAAILGREERLRKSESRIEKWDGATKSSLTPGYAWESK